MSKVKVVSVLIYTNHFSVDYSIGRCVAFNCPAWVATVVWFLVLMVISCL